MKPALPTTGSTMIAATRCARSSASTAPRSLNGATTVSAASASGTPGELGKSERRDARAGADEKRVGVSVIAAVELEDDVALGRRARDAHGAHRRLGAARHEAQHLDVRHPLDDQLCRARPRARSECRSSCRGASSRRARSSTAARRVTEDQRSPRQHVVDVLAVRRRPRCATPRRARRRTGRRRRRERREPASSRRPGTERARALHDLARARHSPTEAADRAEHGERARFADARRRRRDHADQTTRAKSTSSITSSRSNVDERARSDAARTANVRHPVDVVGLPRGASLHRRVVDTIDERADHASEARSYRSAVIKPLQLRSIARAARASRASGTSSSISAARVPSCGEYVNAPTRSNCTSSRKASSVSKSSSVSPGNPTMQVVRIATSGTTDTNARRPFRESCAAARGDACAPAPRPTRAESACRDTAGCATPSPSARAAAA